jgi:hypothetical protein
MGRQGLKEGIFMRLVLGLLAALATAGAANAQERLPLERGWYVVEGTPCGRASEATMVLFDGQGFARPGAACLTTGTRREGASHVVSSACRALATSEERRFDMHVTVYSRTSFGMGDEAGQRRYRHCPRNQLPARWQRD